jgi:hypothetical protein
LCYSVELVGYVVLTEGAEELHLITAGNKVC